jgi:cephalosporin-C deacetylase-like acetyl esterase
MRGPILPESARSSFVEFVRSQTRAARAGDTPPQTLEDWTRRRLQIRTRLARAYGEFPATPCTLDPQLLGTIDRDGYRIERLIFQSRPGVWVTANAYVPTHATGKRPGVLSVHGHWPWARIDPVPHARAIGLVKLGYFVLAVDAFGAGERAIEPSRGTYHGSLLGASTWPVGTPLVGLQVYDNMRAADYMISRPEVDGDKLAITGASGGGNQSMNAGAWDERFKAVVPVCSVGTYDAYVGAACCVCEVLPGGLTIAEEGDILALVAPRALLVISATRDAHQFSVGEAEKSVARARPAFELLDASDRLRHVAIDSGHDYNRPMREALYGWLARWLKDEGDASPIAEPEISLEEVDRLRCFPDNVRPASFTLMPAFVHEQAKQNVRRLVRPDHRERWEADALLMKTRLETRIFGGFPRSTAGKFEAAEPSHGQDTREQPFVLYPEPGVPIPCVLLRRKNLQGALGTVILVDPAGKEAALKTRMVHTLLDGGWQILALDLRATGETAVANDTVTDAIDHNSTEWSIWMGRPILGQWCWDLMRAMDELEARDDVDVRNLALVGSGAGGLAAICTAALDERVRSVAAFGLLASFVTPLAPQGHRMATFVPFILEIGDVAHLAALVAPRRLIIARPVDAQSQSLNDQASSLAFSFTQQVYHWYATPGALRIEASFSEDLLAEALRGV